MVRNYEKKHYIEIAKLLKSLEQKSENKETIDLYLIDEAFIALFSQDSEKFDKERFLKSCKSCLKYISIFFTIAG